MDHQNLSGPSYGSQSIPSTTSPTSPAAVTGPRGNAQLACNNCRKKKIRCDEGRPRCKHCDDRDLSCDYGETKPLKKDKTVLEIRDIVTRMEQDVHETKEAQVEQGKIQLEQGRILTSLLSGMISTGLNVNMDSSQGSPFPLPASRQASASQQATTRRTSVSTLRAQTRPSHHLNPSEGGFNQPYRHATAAHKMLTWPAIQHLLKDTGASNIADFERLKQEGTAFVVGMCKNMPRLPVDEIPYADQKPFLGMQTAENRVFGGPRVEFLYLDPRKMTHLANSYFDTFNILYPFLDRDGFMEKIMKSVVGQGFDSDPQSVTALLVFALGEVADDSLSGSNIGAYPGIELYNEARKRMGFLQTGCDVENVQICSLAALYLQCCFHHVDFWRMASSASSACHILITCTVAEGRAPVRLFVNVADSAIGDLSNSIDWDSPEGELVKRAYWHCAILETGLHLELDLPLTGLLDLSDPPSSVMNWDHAYMNTSEEDNLADLMSQYRAHHASQLTLRRLCSQVHDEINESMGTSMRHGTTSEGFGGPTANTLFKLEEQLQNWRNLLASNPYLQWPENDPTAYPFKVNPQLTGHQNLDPALGNVPKMFYMGTAPAQLRFPFVYEIQVALLRTRYYYARYMICRPYVYKVLHFPNELNTNDLEAAATCLKSCLKWPITMLPVSSHKRLIPYTFCWSQNFLGIILIFTLTRTNSMLAQIVETYCGGPGSQFEIDVNNSLQLMLDWIRDLSSLCPIANWCLDVLTPLMPIIESGMMGV